jgi:hypothetical protein
MKRWILFGSLELLSGFVSLSVDLGFLICPGTQVVGCVWLEVCVLLFPCVFLIVILIFFDSIIILLLSFSSSVSCTTKFPSRNRGTGWETAIFEDLEYTYVPVSCPLFRIFKICCPLFIRNSTNECLLLIDRIFNLLQEGVSEA